MSGVVRATSRGASTPAGPLTGMVSTRIRQLASPATHPAIASLPDQSTGGGFAAPETLSGGLRPVLRERSPGRQQVRLFPAVCRSGSQRSGSQDKTRRFPVFPCKQPMPLVRGSPTDHWQTETGAAKRGGQARLRDQRQAVCLRVRRRRGNVGVISRVAGPGGYRGSAWRWWQSYGNSSPAELRGCDRKICWAAVVRKTL